MTIFFYWWRLLLQIFHTAKSQKICQVSQNNAMVLSSLIVTLNNALFNDCTPDIVGHNSIKLFVFLQLRYAALWTEKNRCINLYCVASPDLVHWQGFSVAILTSDLCISLVLWHSFIISAVSSPYSEPQSFFYWQSCHTIS